MPKPKTQAQIDRATDLQMMKKYGRGLDWYNSQFEKQGGVCAITSRPPTNRRLHIDHDHSWTKVKIQSQRIREAWNRTNDWEASAVYNKQCYIGHGRTKRQAVQKVKELLKRASVRGLLSYAANVGLQKFSDNPKYLRSAAQYLENHQEGK